VAHSHTVTQSVTAVPAATKRETFYKLTKHREAFQLFFALLQRHLDNTTAYRNIIVATVLTVPSANILQ
jgi:hypothetical protein